MALQPHQDRVIAERDELDVRLTKLNEFFQNDVFHVLPLEERTRLKCQALFMRGYLTMLNERIHAFGGAA
jgi:hypothetical protein